MVDKLNLYESMSAHGSASLCDAAERLRELIVKPTILGPRGIAVGEQEMKAMLLETGPVLPAAGTAITSNTADEADEMTDEEASYERRLPVATGATALSPTRGAYDSSSRRVSKSPESVGQVLAEAAPTAASAETAAANKK
jgi:hypothetical protein